jgi:bifunctional non-homologous end joining protein LigD
VSEKTKKGYTPSERGIAYTGTASEARDTGFRPQLLNEIDESEAVWYITDDRYLAQEKHDGRRRGLLKKGGKTEGANKKGLSVGIPEALEKEVLGLNGDNTIDGEDLGQLVPVFDLLMVDGEDIRAKWYQDRYKRLETLITGAKCKFMRLAETAWTTEEKRALFERLKKEGAEGIVFKLKAAPHTPGCPASGGPQLKCKFYASTAFIVSKANIGKRSVAIAMLLYGSEISVGNVTIPPNVEIPAENSIIEVRYLYANKKDTGGGILQQPVYVGPRDDVDREECDVKKLKYKKQGITDDEDA